MARNPLNPRSYRYAISAAHFGVASVAEMSLCLETGGVHHSHREFQVLGLLAGEMRLIFDAAAAGAKPGCLCVIRPDEAHHVATPAERPNLTYIDLRVLAQPQTPLALHLAALAARRGPVVVVGLPALRQSAAALRALAEAHAHVPDASLMAAVWALMALADAAPASPAAPGTAPPPAAELPDPRLRFVEAVMREQLPWAPAVSKLAARTNLSVSQLTRLYRRHAGISPAARMRQMRLEKATQLLAGSTLSVKQVADACGFANPRHFSRLFREHAGQTPKAFRAAAHARPPAE